jgi:hypothetical protein
MTRRGNQHIQNKCPEFIWSSHGGGKRVVGVHRHLCISNSPQPENSKNQGFKAKHNHATVPPTLPRGQEKMWGKRSRSLTTIARGGKPEATENTRTIHQDPAPDQPAPNSCNLFPPPNLQTLRMRAAGLLS